MPLADAKQIKSLRAVFGEVLLLYLIQRERERERARNRETETETETETERDREREAEGGSQPGAQSPRPGFTLGTTCCRIIGSLDILYRAIAN